MRNKARNPSDLRIATYNIEWFTNLFDKHDELLLDREWSSRYKINRGEQAKAIAEVFRAMDADIVLIIEAPNTGEGRSTIRALQNFAEHFGLRHDHAIMGFDSETHQELAFLYDPAVVKVRHDPRGRPSNGDIIRRAPRFDGHFKLDVDVDGQPDVHRFSKPPVEVEVVHKASGKVLRLIGVHVKSKMAHGAVDEADATRISIANRRKQLAQCIWIRERVEDHIKAGESVIVLGDFNDGPGLDAYEKLFGKSGVEVVLGDAGEPETRLHDPYASILLNPRQGWAVSSARFYHAGLRWYVNALLDYVMISSDLMRAARPDWHIFHPFDDPQCYSNAPLRKALLTASDHFPVCIDLTL